MNNIRRFLSPRIKAVIINSLPYRLLSRYQLPRHDIRFSCELTTRCNVVCDICTRSSFIREGKVAIGDMDENIIGRIIEEIGKFYNHGERVYFVPLGLGEPLLYKGLFGVFRKIKNISGNIGIVLVTNGILLDELCCRGLISIGVDEVAVSLNAADASGYRQHMGVDGYDKARRNIETLIRLRNESSKKRPAVFVQYIDYGNSRKFLKEDIDKWSKIMRYADKCYIHPVVNQAGFFSGGYSFDSANKRYPCAEPLWRIAVKINGDMYPCDSSLYSGAQKVPSLYLGNIINDSPFNMLTRADNKQAKIVKAMRCDDYSRIPECERCNTYKLGVNHYFGLPGKVTIKGYRWI